MKKFKIGEQVFLDRQIERGYQGYRVIIKSLTSNNLFANVFDQIDPDSEFQVSVKRLTSCLVSQNI